MDIGIAAASRSNDSLAIMNYAHCMLPEQPDPARVIGRSRTGLAGGLQCICDDVGVQLCSVQRVRGTSADVPINPDELQPEAYTVAGSFPMCRFGKLELLYTNIDTDISKRVQLSGCKRRRV